MSEQSELWARRSPAKQVVRDRIWAALEESGVAVGPARNNIPNFAGADTAAFRMVQTDAWKAARNVKCNPDPPQIPLRLRALYEGKVLYCPVPALTRDFPYLEIDPAELEKKGVSFELAATSEGYMQHGRRLGFEDVPGLDFCIVGSVAVTRSGGRIGKGAGFADLETGIFRELGTIRPDTPMVTLVHSTQVVDEDQMTMMAHDSPLDMFATEAELVVTGNAAPRPKGVDWEQVQPDQFRDIPFLAALRDRMVAGA
ncbi:5-formyltetrahydrofolate cyclo-ligase [Mangrovicoccus sp. HB161399]|uniref:5-formyltetrahydrofolate cyclo-ligase n=1 Tax=Mangrovicoccus sp. HB161399 TaxID=2720392 RepID=UPI001553200D|nr:5-formyltetrahydrofolate cyclo-ligase [Mangrovicoccus sp. HB161399]